MNICNVLRDARREKGITQEKLCYGLCSKSMLSKIENGQKYPNEMLFSALMERLGKDVERCNILGTTKDIQKKYLRMQITQNVRMKRNDRLRKELEVYRELLDEKDKLGWQFYFMVLSSTYEGREERLRCRMKAIHMTVPNFSMEYFEKYFYSYNELLLMNMIGAYYHECEDYCNAEKIYEKTLNYLSVNWEESIQKNYLKMLVTSNLINVWLFTKKYYEVLVNCEKGVEECIKNRNYEFLYKFYYARCVAKIRLGYIEKERDKINGDVLKMYYVCKLIGKEKLAEVLRKDLKEIGEVEFAIETLEGFI